MSDRTTTSDRNNLSDDLALFGIEPIESKIYLHLVDKPPKSILEISRELSLPRTSVYDGVTKLQDKGLVEKIVQHKNQRIKAYPVSILQTYIDKEKARAELLQEKLAVLEQNIAHAGFSLPTTEVRYYHGVRGLQQMFWNTLRTQDEMIGYSQFGIIDIFKREFSERYESERTRLAIKSRIITNPERLDRWRINLEPVAKFRQTFQQCRVVPADLLYVSGDIAIYNNVFAAAYWGHGEVVGVEIENPEIVKTQKTLFNLVWQQGKPVAWDEKAA